MHLDVLRLCRHSLGEVQDKWRRWWVVIAGDLG